MSKISTYPLSTTLHDEDLFDKSNTENGGASFNESQKVKWSQIKAQIIALSANFGNTNLTLTGDRDHNLGGYYARFNNGNVGIDVDPDVAKLQVQSDLGLAGFVVEDSSGAAVFGVDDFGDTTINGKLKVNQANYSDGSTTLESFIANNLGYIFQTNRNAAVNWNDYNNQIGADTDQTWKSHFNDYEINPAKFEGSTNKPHIHAQHRSSDSLAFTKIGINARNTTDNVLLYVELDKFGSDVVANPTIEQLLDNYGDYSINNASNVTKTGLDIKLGGDGNAYNNIGVGDAIHKCLTLSAESADLNIALQVEKGLVIIDSIPTGSTGLPVGALYKMGTNVHIV